MPTEPIEGTIRKARLHDKFNEWTSGGAQDNNIPGDEAGSYIHGLAGNDFFAGGEGINVLIGDMGDDILVLNNAYDVDVSIGANAAGMVEFTFDGGGTLTLSNVQYQNGMNVSDFNIEWN